MSAREIDHFFKGQPFARQLFETVRTIFESQGSVEIKVTRSQIVFKRKRGFAWIWMPGQYLHRKADPLVLSIGLRRRDLSPRWKQVIEPYPGWFMHHLEFFSTDDLDEEIPLLLAETRDSAG